MDPVLKEQIVAGMMPVGEFDGPTLSEMFLLAVSHGHVPTLEWLKSKMDATTLVGTRERLYKSGYDEYANPIIYNHPICMCLRNGHLSVLEWLDKNGFGDLWNVKDVKDAINSYNLGCMIGGAFVSLKEIRPSSINVLRWLNAKDIIVTLNKHCSLHSHYLLRKAGFIDTSYTQGYSHCWGTHTVYQFSSSISEAVMVKKLEVAVGALNQALALVGNHTDLKRAFDLYKHKESAKVKELRLHLRKKLALLMVRVDVGDNEDVDKNMDDE